VDVIIPIPLHPKKEKKRGYNQAAIIGKGMAGEMKIPVRTDLLLRVGETETQTKKGHYDRWENVSSVFAINNPEHFPFEHVLLVDDVITTGATLEACAQRIFQDTRAKVSIATLAVAYN
jgi:ComF family protein